MNVQVHPKMKALYQETFDKAYWRDYEIFRRKGWDESNSSSFAQIQADRVVKDVYSIDAKTYGRIIPEQE